MKSQAEAGEQQKKTRAEREAPETNQSSITSQSAGFKAPASESGIGCRPEQGISGNAETTCQERPIRELEFFLQLLIILI
jgi:hypothetical protein